VYLTVSFVSSNYGPTIAVQNEASKQGCQQVLWLYGEKEEITEVGTMNLFIYWTNEKGGQTFSCSPLGLLKVFCVCPGRNISKVKVFYVFAERELVTPPLDGIILPGVTRQSLLDLGRAWVRRPNQVPV